MKTKLNFKIIKEGVDNEINYTEEEKQRLLDSLKDFTNLQDSIYRKEDLKSIGKAVDEICEFINYDKTSNVDEWLDQVTIKRHLKNLNDVVKDFQNTIRDIVLLQQRLEADYEDISTTINRYYEFSNESEKTQEPNIPISEEEIEDALKEMKQIAKKNKLFNK